MIKLTSCGLTVIILFYAGSSFAGSNRFDISPQECVTLKQGNNCYQGIEVQWQTEQPDNYCLTLSTQEKPLQCWINRNMGKFEFEFVGSASAQISLRHKDSGKIFEQSNIVVKWVYRSRSRNLGWRMF